jgi:hypothetical protein
MALGDRAFHGASAVPIGARPIDSRSYASLTSLTSAWHGATLQSTEGGSFPIGRRLP